MSQESSGARGFLREHPIVGRLIFARRSKAFCARRKEVNARKLFSGLFSSTASHEVIDNVAVALGHGVSRRQVLRGLLGGSVIAVASSAAFEHAYASGGTCRATGQACNVGGDCCNDYCGPNHVCWCKYDVECPTGTVCQTSTGACISVGGGGDDDDDGSDGSDNTNNNTNTNTNVINKIRRRRKKGKGKGRKGRGRRRGRNRRRKGGGGLNACTGVGTTCTNN